MIGLVHTCGTGVGNTVNLIFFLILASTAVGAYEDEEEEDAIGEDEDDSTDGSEAGEIGRMA